MLRIIAGWFLSLIIAFVPTALYPASFDCLKAVTGIEKMICAHEELSAADEKLARAYRAAYRKTRDRKALNGAQRSWVRKRNSAVDLSELRALYAQRIAELKNGAADPSPRAWKADERGSRRAYFSNDGELEINDLGYGKIAFRLLVINHQGHVGELQGVMSVRNGAGRYVAEECELDFSFERDLIAVKQNFNKGTCRAGTNVALEGVYRLPSRNASKR